MGDFGVEDDEMSLPTPIKAKTDSSMSYGEQMAFMQGSNKAHEEAAKEIKKLKDEIARLKAEIKRLTRQKQKSK